MFQTPSWECAKWSREKEMEVIGGIEKKKPDWRDEEEKQEYMIFLNARQPCLLRRDTCLEGRLQGGVLLPPEQGQGALDELAVKAWLRSTSCQPKWAVVRRVNLE